uniref:Uncharacterized protein n=3 Tax=Stomoxys calcitrans TaxID=35570 RepID=A0A1I8Q2M3_STOCA
MAFLNKLKGAPLPPIKNILNVAVQTARQHMPEKKDPASGGGSAMPQSAQEPSSTQAMFQGDENTYGTTDDRPTELNPFRNPNGGWMDDGDASNAKGEGYQTTSFNEYDGRYQQTDGFRQGSVASEGSSFVCEGEGGGGSKIDEMQAA